MYLFVQVDISSPLSCAAFVSGVCSSEEGCTSVMLCGEKLTAYRAHAQALLHNEPQRGHAEGYL